MNRSPSLRHLLYWMTGCAVYFALSRHFLRSAPSGGADIARLSALALYTGLCWTGAAVALEGLAARGRMVLEPGAWWLVSLACILTVDLIVPQLPKSWSVRPESLQMGITGLALALPTLSHRMPGRWRALFGTLALLVAGKLVWLLMTISQGVAMPVAWVDRYARMQSVVGLVLLAIVVIGDRRSEQHYGWLHWTGIFCGIVWLLL